MLALPQAPITLSMYQMLFCTIRAYVSHAEIENTSKMMHKGLRKVEEVPMSLGKA